MDFSLDETQREIATLAADVLRRDPDQPWKALDQAGLLGLARPERLGGDGLGVIETCVVLAEVGRAAVDTPALATLALGVLPIVHMGTPEQQDRLLSGVLTAAMRGEVTATGGGLTGTKVHVLHADQATSILVTAGPEVYVVNPADVTMARSYTASGQPEFTVTLSDAPGNSSAPPPRCKRLRSRGRVRWVTGWSPVRWS
ncbi:hypothetical protein GCM10029964_100190 [Kibdelosporangium lantanae]